MSHEQLKIGFGSLNVYKVTDAVDPLAQESV